MTRPHLIFPPVSPRHAESAFVSALLPADGRHQFHGEKRLRREARGQIGGSITEYSIRVRLTDYDAPALAELSDGDLHGGAGRCVDDEHDLEALW